MKFTSTEPYRSFNGYTFVNGKPVDVTDKATIAALLKDPTMRRVEDETAPEERQGQAPADQAAVLTTPAPTSTPVFPTPEYPRRAILKARR